MTQPNFHKCGKRFDEREVSITFILSNKRETFVAFRNLYKFICNFYFFYIRLKHMLVNELISFHSLPCVWEMSVVFIKAAGHAIRPFANVTTGIPCFNLKQKWNSTIKYSKRGWDTQSDVRLMSWQASKPFNHSSRYSIGTNILTIFDANSTLKFPFRMKPMSWRAQFT